MIVVRHNGIQVPPARTLAEDLIYTHGPKPQPTLAKCGVRSDVRQAWDAKDVAENEAREWLAAVATYLEHEAISPADASDLDRDFLAEGMADILTGVLKLNAHLRHLQPHKRANQRAAAQYANVNVRSKSIVKQLLGLREETAEPV